MSARPRRTASSSSSSVPASSGAKGMAAKTQSEKKRPPLRNITNQRSTGSLSQRPSLASSKPLVPCTSKVAKTKKESEKSVPVTCSLKSSARVRNEDGSLARPKTVTPRMDSAVPSVSTVSPSGSANCSVSLDETMSICDSFNSPEVEYVDAGNACLVESTGRKSSIRLFLPERAEIKGEICKKDILDMEKVVDIDDNIVDPQFCATFASDIYKHLRESEARKRPSVDYMERVHNDINPVMRAIMIDWLVEVSEEYRLLPETLFLAVNYIDRYLSGNAINRQRLQLLGITCLMIAAKHEEITTLPVEEFCFVTDNTYLKEEVLQMEFTVLNYLKFEMTAPTTKCFLRRFIRAAEAANEVSPMNFECLVNYIAELSLLDYNMLHFAPSLIAASAAFLAKFILAPSKKPWDSTLHHYTLYRPSDLHDCVHALHHLCHGSVSSHLPAIREKYSQHKYKFVAKKYCSRTIPPEFFSDASDQQQTRSAPL